MYFFKRWTSALVSRVDWMAAQVENQEALVNSAIREAQQATAKAKVQLARVHGDGNKLRNRLEEEQQAEQRWRDRARSCAEEDEAKALECLRRSKQAGKQAGQLKGRIEEHQRVEHQLQADVQTLQERLAELVEKRNLMRTRESRASAMKTVSEVMVPMNDGLDDIFERWDTRITEAEIISSCCEQSDPLDSDFVTAEEEDALRAELEELKNNSRDD